MMKIQIGGLSEGVHEYGFRTKAGEIGLGSTFPGDVLVEVSLDKAGTQILLRGTVRSEGRFACDRCTGEFDIPISTSYQMYYVSEGVEFEEIDPAELQVIPHGAGSIDISDDVRQTVLLAVPLKLLCSEKCPGLCPKCGKDLNQGNCTCDARGSDPRWEPLKSLGGN